MLILLGIALYDEACEENIRKGGCMRSKGNRSDTQFSLQHIIGCLTKNDAELTPLKPLCKQKVFKYRQMIMSDYRLNPAMIEACDSDIYVFCNGQRFEPVGETARCLIKHAQNRIYMQLQPGCKREVFAHMKLMNVGDDYRVDRLLNESCWELINNRCKHESAQLTLSCLMRNLHDINDECSQRLLEVQYFIARDWTLDPRLYSACQKDAAAKCSATPQSDPLKVNASHVLSCLYDAAYAIKEEHTLSPQCASSARRALIERASHVQLLPDIEKNCHSDLYNYCSEKTAAIDVNSQLSHTLFKPPKSRLQELFCLQQHLFDIDRNCCVEVTKFTVKMSIDTMLHPVLFHTCRTVIGRYCEKFLRVGIDNGDVMQCLFENKDAEEMSPKCLAHVVQFEWVLMRDYHFSYKFNMTCADAISTHCPHYYYHSYYHEKLMTAVSQCLLTYDHRTHQLDEECRQQVHIEYLQQSKLEVNNHAMLLEGCATEISSHRCNKTGETTVENVLECLRKHKSESNGRGCLKFLFEREQVEIADNRLDGRLQRECATEIELLCSQQPLERVLSCLKMHRRTTGMSVNCWEVVQDRMRQQAVDIVLQPNLLNACSDEVKRYCDLDFKRRNETRFRLRYETEGIVIGCLRYVVTHSWGVKPSIHPECKKEVFRVIVESSLDPQLDRPFYKACQQPMYQYCDDAPIWPGPIGGSGQPECMKSKLSDLVMLDRPCRREIERQTKEQLVDIRIDPILFESCSVDLKNFCSAVTPGQGRRSFTCLTAPSPFARDSVRLQSSAACSRSLMTSTCRMPAEHDSTSGKSYGT